MNYGIAIEYYNKAFQALAKDKGLLHPEVIRIYIRMAKVYKVAGKYTQSIKYFDLALDAAKRLQKPSPALLAEVYHEKGVAYFNAARYIEALDSLRQGFNLRKKVFGEKHPDVINSYIVLALAYGKKGDLARSFAYSNRARKIAGEILGPEHKYTRIATSNMIWARLQMFRQKNAGKKHQLSQAGSSGRNRSLRLAASQQALGLRQLQSGKPQQAIIYFSKVLQTRQQALDAQHPDIAVSMYYLSLAYQAAGNNKQAMFYARSAIRVVYKPFGSGHPVTRLYMSQLARLRKQSKR